MRCSLVHRISNSNSLTLALAPRPRSSTAPHPPPPPTTNASATVGSLARASLRLLLAVEQSMADYAAVIQAIQKEHGMVGAPVVSLGGSYSGKLSAYSKGRGLPTGCSC